MMTRWYTVPAVAVQGVHPSCTRRLCTPYVNMPSDRLPNGLTRPDRVKIEASFRLGNDFHFLARVVRDENLGTLLQVDPQAFDMAGGRRVRLELDTDLLTQVYAEMCRRYLAAKGRQYARSEGRN